MRISQDQAHSAHANYMLVASTVEDLQATGDREGADRLARLAEFWRGATVACAFAGLIP